MEPSQCNGIDDILLFLEVKYGKKNKRTPFK